MALVFKNPSFRFISNCDVDGISTFPFNVRFFEPVDITFPFNVIFPSVEVSFIFSSEFSIISVASKVILLAVIVPLIEVLLNVTSFANKFPVINVLPAVCVKSIGLSVVPKVVVEFSSLPKETELVVKISQEFFIVVSLEKVIFPAFSDVENFSISIGVSKVVIPFTTTTFFIFDVCPPNFTVLPSSLFTIMVSYPAEDKSEYHKSVEPFNSIVPSIFPKVTLLPETNNLFSETIFIVSLFERFPIDESSFNVRFPLFSKVAAEIELQVTFLPELIVIVPFENIRFPLNSKSVSIIRGLEESLQENVPVDPTKFGLTVKPFVEFKVPFTTTEEPVPKVILFASIDKLPPSAIVNFAPSKISIFPPEKSTLSKISG